MGIWRDRALPLLHEGARQARAPSTLIQALGLPPLESAVEEEDEEDEEEEEEEEGRREENEAADDAAAGPSERRLGPDDLLPMMAMLDEVERSCLGKSEASVRSSVQASVDRCPRGQREDIRPDGLSGNSLIRR